MTYDEYKVGEVTHAGRQCTKYVQQVTLSTGSYEKVLYVDNETEMPLYYKDNTKTVEVTKFETSADLSVPEV